MGLLGNKEKKEDKKLREQQEFMERYGLENLDEKDLEILKRITADLTGNKWFKAGMAFSFSKAEEQAKVTYLSVIAEQNWMLLRKLDEISKKLDK